MGNSYLKTEDSPHYVFLLIQGKFITAVKFDGYPQYYTSLNLEAHRHLIVEQPDTAIFWPNYLHGTKPTLAGRKKFLIKIR